MSLSRLRVGLGFLLLIAGFSSAAVPGENSTWNHDPYSLGQGLNFPQQNLVVGGYLSLYYSSLKNTGLEFHGTGHQPVRQ